ncbi:GlcG/HbpS family heme-binding protein [Pseudoxanthomonas sp. 10H]|uniref:GlcG/HbpS family heme-binding protein n=1 Tax=Pseudoxanthomonas sp. 10H TaxID=3242729 RepID=UPI003555CB41
MKHTNLAALAAVACLLANAAHAQTLKPALDPSTADAVRDHCLAHAKRSNHAVAVAVFDQGGQLLSFANHGASPAAGEVALWKGRSAAMYRFATRETANWNMSAAPHISTAEGGVPLFTREGASLGGVGVSGAPSAFDAECGARGAAAAGLVVSPPGH